MLPIRNIFTCHQCAVIFWEKCTNSHKVVLGCSTPLMKSKLVKYSQNITNQKSFYSPSLLFDEIPGYGINYQSESTNPYRKTYLKITRYGYMSKQIHWKLISRICVFSEFTCMSLWAFFRNLLCNCLWSTTGYILP